MARKSSIGLYMTIIGLVFLLTLFVATWIGLYLSRRITVPIHDLAGAAREISAGNLDVYVEIRSDRDVLGQAIATVKDNIDAMNSDLQGTIEAMKQGLSVLDLAKRFKGGGQGVRLDHVRDASAVLP